MFVYGCSSCVRTQVIDYYRAVTALVWKACLVLFNGEQHLKAMGETYCK
jgi:hypothetical protein